MHAVGSALLTTLALCTAALLRTQTQWCVCGALDWACCVAAVGDGQRDEEARPLGVANIAVHPSQPQNCSKPGLHACMQAQVAGQQGAYVAHIINQGYVFGQGGLEGVAVPRKLATLGKWRWLGDAVVEGMYAVGVLLCISV